MGFFLPGQGKIFCVCSCMVRPAAKTEAKGFVWAVGTSETPIRILEGAAVNIAKPLSEMKTLCRQRLAALKHIPYCE